jgi:hypothetical protein
MASLAARMDALTSLTDRLGRRGRLIWYAGLISFSLSMLITALTSVGPDVITRYVAIPSPLDATLQAQGVPLRTASGRMLGNGGLDFALALLVFVIGHILIQRIVRPIPLRVLAYLAAPVWVVAVQAPLAQSIDKADGIKAARNGIAVGWAGAPSAHPDESILPRVPAYHLQPDRLPPVLAEQAHYVLAQQGYLDKDSGRVAAELRAIGHAWRPAEAHTRKRIDLLARWATWRGHDAGAFARTLKMSRITKIIRQTLSSLGFFAGILMAISGLTMANIGQRRRQKMDQLVKRLGDAPDLSDLPAIPLPKAV